MRHVIDTLPNRVLYCFIVLKQVNAIIAFVIVRVNRRSVLDGVLQSTDQNNRRHICHMFGTNLTIALSDSFEGFLANSATTRKKILQCPFVELFTVDIYLVRFNRSRQQLFPLILTFTNSVSHLPCEILTNAEFAMEFQSRNAFQISGYKVDNSRPLLKSYFSFVHRCASLEAEESAAVSAIEDAKVS